MNPETQEKRVRKALRECGWFNNAMFRVDAGLERMADGALCYVQSWVVCFVGRWVVRLRELLQAIDGCGAVAQDGRVKGALGRLREAMDGVTWLEAWREAYRGRGGGTATAEEGESISRLHRRYGELERLVYELLRGEGNEEGKSSAEREEPGREGPTLLSEAQCGDTDEAPGGVPGAEGARA